MAAMLELDFQGKKTILNHPIIRVHLKNGRH
jgi:hypothetical protein